MTAQAQSKETEPSPPTNRWWEWDEVAYIAPILAFLLLAQLGTYSKSLYPPAYIARALGVAILLKLYWRHYTKIRWDYWWLGVIAGVAGIVQWVGMQGWLASHFAMFRPDVDAFNPFAAFHTATGAWAFVVIRVASAAVVVPVMEELFWRDFVWRQILAPNDFKLAQVGEFEWGVFLVVAGLFASAHPAWWPTAAVWGLMIGGLLVYTRSLGACIIMHGVTNLLLAFYVLHQHAWYLW